MSGIKMYFNANLWIETCFFDSNQSGIDIFYGSCANIVGLNSIRESYYFGLRAAYKSQVIFRPRNLREFTSTIYTEGALSNYSAIRAEKSSDIILYEDDPTKFQELGMALVEILNYNAYTGPTYYGVSLGSNSMFVGASKVSFAVDPGEPKYNEGKATIPDGQQFVTIDDSSCGIIK